MLNPYQKSHLSITNKRVNYDKIDDTNKPNIIDVYQNLSDNDCILKSAGRAKLVLCPFHGEQNSSLALYEDTNSYHCFACGASGDSYKMIMELQELDFKDAIAYAKEHNLYDN